MPTSSPRRPPTPECGIGLRTPHLETVLAARPVVPWFEVHAENHMRPGPARDALLALRADYPLSLHGVGLSLGGAVRPDRAHLGLLRELADRVSPFLVSEHLAWCGTADGYLNDLLPVPYTAEAFALVARHIDETQEILGRRILIENPSSYLSYRHSTIPEAEFLAALARRTGCGILLDVNNVHVSAWNVGLDPVRYLSTLPADAVMEIHVAGHAIEDWNGEQVAIDTHGAAVDAAVWDLYREALRRIGARPTLLERDKNIPALETLMAEARIADAIVAEMSTEATHAIAV